MEHKLSARELAEWTAFYSINPFGSWRDNWHMAVLASILVNAHSDKGHSASPGEFMFKDPETVARQRDEAAIAFLDSLMEKKS